MLVFYCRPFLGFCSGDYAASRPMQKAAAAPGATFTAAAASDATKLLFTHSADHFLLDFPKN